MSVKECGVLDRTLKGNVCVNVDYSCLCLLCI